MKKAQAITFLAADLKPCPLRSKICRNGNISGLNIDNVMVHFIQFDKMHSNGLFGTKNKGFSWLEFYSNKLVFQRVEKGFMKLTSGTKQWV